MKSQIYVWNGETGKQKMPAYIRVRAAIRQPRLMPRMGIPGKAVAASVVVSGIVASLLGI